MATATSETSLALDPRDDTGSRSMRRLRRAGRVPGVIYGGAAEPVTFEVDARILRNTLRDASAVIEVSVDGKTENVVVKDVQRHPVRGDILHADFLRVRMDVAIQTPVTIELIGAEDGPGVDEGGILNHELREVNVEALPGDIPDVITVDVSKLEMNDTMLLESLTAPKGVTFVDDPETVVATITPPTLEPEEDEIETETELVGEDGEPVAEGEEGGDSDGDGESSDSDS